MTSRASKKVFSLADDVLGFPFSRLCFEGPQDALSQTQNQQLAILITSIAYLEALKEGKEDSQSMFTAGHSIGEYVALVASRAISFEDAVRLVQERGRLMQEAGEREKGGMAAILGMGEEEIEEICKASGVEMANINCPGQVVISGSEKDLETALKLARPYAKRIIPLRVSGAFHSRLMREVREEFSHIVALFPISDPFPPVVSNVKGEPLTRASQIQTEIVDQLSCPVKWQESVERMIDMGVDEFWEVGPGEVLCGLIRRINKTVSVVNVERRLNLREERCLNLQER